MLSTIAAPAWGFAALIGAGRSVAQLLNKVYFGVHLRGSRLSPAPEVQRDEELPRIGFSSAVFGVVMAVSGLTALAGIPSAPPFRDVWLMFLGSVVSQTSTMLFAFAWFHGAPLGYQTIVQRCFIAAFATAGSAVLLGEPPSRLQLAAVILLMVSAGLPLNQHVLVRGAHKLRWIWYCLAGSVVGALGPIVTRALWRSAQVPPAAGLAWRGIWIAVIGGVILACIGFGRSRCLSGLNRPDWICLLVTPLLGSFWYYCTVLATKAGMPAHVQHGLVQSIVAALSGVFGAAVFREREIRSGPGMISLALTVGSMVLFILDPTAHPV